MCFHLLPRQLSEVGTINTDETTESAICLESGFEPNNTLIGAQSSLPLPPHGYLDLAAESQEGGQAFA